MTLIDRPPVPEPTDPPRKRDRTHWLYIAVIIAVFAGVAVGILSPSVGKSVGVLGTMFVDLIKMMIAPVIFCTIVLGIGSVRKAATVGKVGGLAFAYFLVMSTFALAIVSGSAGSPCCSRRSMRSRSTWKRSSSSPFSDLPLGRRTRNGSTLRLFTITS